MTPSTSKLTVPFVLSCTECDLGDEINSQRQAKRAGWTDLTFDPDGLSWTWVGVCSGCRADLDRPFAAQQLLF